MAPCKFFAEGRCDRGASCNFSHHLGGPRDSGHGSGNPAGRGQGGAGRGRGRTDSTRTPEKGRRADAAKGGRKGGKSTGGKGGAGRGCETGAGDADRRFFDRMVKSGDRFGNPQSDARKFLAAAVAFDDGADMLYRLVNAADNGEKQVRSALSANDTASFLNESVHPFLERLGSDELYIGTARAPMEQILDAVYTTPGFMGNLCAKLEVAGQIRDPTLFGWFVLNVAARKREARDDAYVQRIATALAHQDVPIAQRLATVLNGGPSTTSATGGSLGDERNLPGGRHDNDFPRFRDVSILPTMDEVLCERSPYLPEPLPLLDASLPQAQLSGTPSLAAPRVAAVLDRQFRLLREDFLAPLRDELQLLKRSENGEGRPPRFTFPDVKLIGVEAKPRPCILVSFTLPPGHGAQLCRNTKEREKFWEDHRGILALESLCVLAVEGRAERFATIVRRNAQELAKSKMVGLAFEDATIDEMSRLLARCGSDRSARRTKTALVQVSSGLFQYKPVLRCLQGMNTVPLLEELVMNQPSEPTTYLDLERAQAELEKFPYDHHQLAAMMLAIRSRVSITQGPPGTGKTFMGVRLVDIIYRLTDERILCVCFTNHALDDFMGDLLSENMTSMVRIGGNSKDPRLEPYLIKNVVQNAGGHDRAERRRYAELSQRAEDLEAQIGQLSKRTQYMIGEKWWDTVGDFLFDWDRHAWSQLCLLQEDMTDEDGFEVVHDGGKLAMDALWKRWLKGQDATSLRSARGDRKRELYLREVYPAGDLSEAGVDLWALSKAERAAKKEEWQYELFRDERDDLAQLMIEYDKVSLQIRDLRRATDQAVLRRTRIIGCTTTGAAMFKSLIEAARPTVVIVEEAAEILEAHVLTSLQEHTKHLIMIGDHKQLRPKLNTYELSVACRTTNCNFNCSLFERLVLSGSIKYASLAAQHRMHPQISKLIRPTYGNLLDAERTHSLPPVRGVKSRVVFLTHDKPEGGNAAWKVEALSKTNEHEVGLVRAIVRYLIQQGYEPTQLVVLTPYLGQLQLLKSALSEDCGVLVGEVDQRDLTLAVGAGGREMTTIDSEPDEHKGPDQKPVRVATVDNFQGEEADIVIISLVRSNAEGSIGFLYEPERVNVLLSRARHGQIIIGNSTTFRHAKNPAGAHLWTEKLKQLASDKQLYEGFPAYCPMHKTDVAQKLCTPEAFEFAVPCGGCTLLCTEKLPCGHDCPLRCHPYDVSHPNVKCTASVFIECDEGHLFEGACGTPTDASACKVCDELRRMQREAALELRQSDKIAAERIAEAATRKKLAETHAAMARNKLDQLDREKASALAALQSELEAERLVREEELWRQAQPEEAAIAALAARARAQEELSAKEEAAALERQRRGEELERERRKLAAKSEKELSDVERQLATELQELANRRARAETERRDRTSMLTETAETDRSGVEEAAELRTRLAAAVQSANRTAVLEALNQASTRAVEKLVGMRIEPRSDALVIPPSCKRGVDLLAHKKWLAAIRVFESAAGADEPNGAASLLAALCKLQLGEMDDSMERICESTAGDEPHGLRALVLSSVRDAQTKSEERAARRKSSVIVVRHALSFLASDVAEQFPPCACIAFQILKRHDELLIPSLPPPKAADTGVDAEIRKLASKANTTATKKLWELTGILPVKKTCLQIKDRVELSQKRGEDIKKTNYNAIFTGNPGTGKTTVARLYGELLAETGVLPASTFEETSGAKLIADGISKLKELLKNLKDGGVLFVDEAYQLDPKKNQIGAAVLNLLLTEMENLRGTIVVVFAGYDKPMEDLLAFNEGLSSRFQYKFAFPDFSETELHAILTDTIKKHKPSFTVSDSKYVRIAARRLAVQRGTTGFGNARAVRNLWEQVLGRQAVRVIAEQGAGGAHRELEIEREDLLGPRDVKVATQDAINKLNAMRGLESVKSNVESLLQLIQTNVELEELEEKMQQVALNRCLLGNPGTGKTTVAKIYANILKALGLLSKGEVIVKNPSDFIGAALGQSEEKTKTILSAAQGSVLVIDEAYGLHVPEGSKDPYKEAVIDTIVAEVQGVPGDDRCVLLLGYREQMETMMRDANPGLARRFQIDNAFIFEDYSSEDLFHIMSAKAKEDGWEASFETLRAGVAVLEKEKMKPNFGNGGAINNLLSKATTNYELRMKQEGRSALERAQCRRLLPEDMDPLCAGEAAHDKQRKIDALFSDLIGGESVLEQVADIRNTIKLAEQLGRDPRDDVTLNYVFAGPPGTGKTTVARRMGQLFQLFDLLPSSDVVQTTPADLSTGYVGQARKQARKVFESALGKVLFIDEAYGLNPRVGGQFMAEAVDEMVAMLTDERFKGKMMLILAGYEGDMEEMLKTNVGLKSRIPGKITFDPFDATATVELLRVALCKKGLPIGPDVASSELNDMAQQLVESPNFANGRDIHTWADEVYRKVASAPATAASSSSPPNVATIEYIRSALHAFLKKQSAPSGPAQSKLPPSAPPQLAPAEPPLVSAPPAVTLAEPSIEKVEAKEPQGHQVEESFEMVDPPDDDSIYTLLEEAASALSYSIEATRDMCATERFPDDILKYIKEKTNKGSAEAMRGALRAQCPALLIKMDTLIRVKAEEEARTKVEEEAMQAAEARRKRREQIIRCAACGSPICSFMPRVVGYRDVDE